jgi:hypothetical protein
MRNIFYLPAIDRYISSSKSYFDIHEDVKCVTVPESNVQNKKFIGKSNGVDIVGSEINCGNIINMEYVSPYKLISIDGSEFNKDDEEMIDFMVKDRVTGVLGVRDAIARETNNVIDFIVKESEGIRALIFRDMLNLLSKNNKIRFINNRNLILKLAFSNGLNDTFKLINFLNI